MGGALLRLLKYLATTSEEQRSLARRYAPDEVSQLADFERAPLRDLPALRRPDFEDTAPATRRDLRPSQLNYAGGGGVTKGAKILRDFAEALTARLPAAAKAIDKKALAVESELPTSLYHGTYNKSEDIAELRAPMSSLMKYFDKNDADLDSLGLYLAKKPSVAELYGPNIYKYEPKRTGFPVSIDWPKVYREVYGVPDDEVQGLAGGHIALGNNIAKSLSDVGAPGAHLKRVSDQADEYGNFTRQSQFLTVSPLDSLAKVLGVKRPSAEEVRLATKIPPEDWATFRGFNLGPELEKHLRAYEKTTSLRNPYSVQDALDSLRTTPLGSEVDKKYDKWFKKRLKLYAEGGVVEPDRDYDEKMRYVKFRPVSGGRRPERLNASRGVNAPLQVMRGWAAGTLGLPGDVEGLVRMLPGIENETPTLPTSDFYQEWLPGGDRSPAGKFFSGVGALTGGVGATKAAKALQGGARVARRHLGGGDWFEALQAANERERMMAPLKTMAANFATPRDLSAGLRGGQRGAVRVKGGNFDEVALDRQFDEGSPSEDAIEQWQRKQLRNYIRKDLGSPTDPLLALEKELPNLHFNEMPISQGEIANLYDKRRGFYEGRLGNETAQRATRYLDKHDELSGGAPLTPWGRLADSNVIETTAGDHLADELARKGRSLEKRLEALKATDWRARSPEAPMYSLGSLDGDTGLGFDHVRDYLEAATEAHKDLKSLMLSPGSGIERLRGVADPGMRRLLAFHDAGLTLDPKSLERLSVPDAVRKTAQWNALLTNQVVADGPLSKGHKTFKEYPDEGKGMKWVEFGHNKDEFDRLRGLPEGVTAHVSPSGQVAYRDEARGTWIGNEHPQIQVLREGLAAEGDAMGHCVGGYCDDVLRNGTKIYSLRDAKGRPHVTIEARPGRGNTAVQQLDSMPGPKLAELGLITPEQGAALGDGWSSAQWREVTGNQGDYVKWLEESARKLGLSDPAPEIVQIKGKGNAAPVDDYLPYVQDFVRSGKWGRVGDLKNTGLRKMNDVFGTAEIRSFVDVGLMKDGELASATDKYISVDEAIDMLRKSGKNDKDAETIITKAFLRQRGDYAEGGLVQQDTPDEAPGFLPRTLEDWADYLTQGVEHAAAA